MTGSAPCPISTLPTLSSNLPPAIISPRAPAESSHSAGGDIIGVHCSCLNIRVGNRIGAGCETGGSQDDRFFHRSICSASGINVRLNRCYRPIFFYPDFIMQPLGITLQPFFAAVNPRTSLRKKRRVISGSVNSGV